MIDIKNIFRISTFDFIIRFTKKNSILLKVLISYIFLSLILFCLFPFLLINNFSKSYIENESIASKNLVTQLNQTTNLFLTTTYGKFSSLSDSDMQFTQAQYSPNFSSLDVNGICTRLNKEVMLNPLLSSIYVYNFQAGKAFSSKTAYSDISDFYDKNATDILTNYSKYKNRIFISRNNGENDIVSIFYNNISSDGKILSSVILNIDASTLEKLLSKNSRDSLSKIYIIDRNGYTILPSDQKTETAKYDKNVLFKQILSSNNNNGYFKDEADGTNTLISYSKSTGLGWYFINITDYGTILEKLAPYKTYTLYVSILFIIISLLVAMYFANSIYNPFYKLLKELKSKNIKIDNNKLGLNELDYLKYTLDDLDSNIKVLKTNEDINSIIKKQNLLTKAICGDVYWNLETRQEMKDLKIEFNAQEYMVIIFKIDSIEEYKKNYPIDDITILKYSILNIVTQTLSIEYNTEIISNNFDCVTLILSLVDDSKDLTQNTLPMINLILTDVEKYLKFTISASLGNIVDNFESINISYENALHFLNYRILNGNSSIISYYDFYERELTHSNYPFEIESELLSIINKNQVVKIEETTERFFTALCSMSYNEFYLCIAKLLMAIDNDLKTSSICKTSNITFNFNEVYEICRKLTSLNEIKNYVISKLSELVSNITYPKTEKNEQITKTILEYIENNYSNFNMSVDVIADHIGLSSNYIRSIFKNVTNQSLSNYINEFKIKKTMLLLETSDFTAKEICFMSGFTDNKYFYSVFKKYTGLTTEEYKKKCNKE